MTKTILIASLVGALVIGSAGAALALDPSAREAALRDLGFAPADCRDFTWHGARGLFCLDRANMTESKPFKHVSFHVDAANDTITDYASVGPWSTGVIFTSIHLSAADNESTRAHGDDFVLDSSAWTWRAHDEGNAPWTIRAKSDTTVTLTLGPHDNASVEKDGTLVLVTKSGHVAKLHVEGKNATAALSGDVITLTLPAGTGAHFAIGGHVAPKERHEQDHTRAEVLRHEKNEKDDDADDR